MEGKTGLTGVVLCGGMSSRMGTDKGLLKIEGETWAGRTASTLASCVPKVIFSVNASQLDRYKEVHPGEEFHVDSHPEADGPLGGILSVYSKVKTDIFAVACDMPYINSDALKHLHDHYKHKSREYDFFPFVTDRMEPTCAIYTASGLEYMLKNLRHDYSLKRFFISGRVFQVKVPKGAEFVFRNLNTPEDVQSAGLG